jgi:ribonucleoside-triphosphate reductase
MPYISITPTFSICKEHGYLKGEQFKCPICNTKTEVWSRVTGYLRPVENYNVGKKEEYSERVKYRL